MPYAPGVQDQSGQNLAQGINQFGNSMQQGMHNFQQNQIMTSQSIGKVDAAIKANPELEQVLTGPLAPKDAAAAYAKLTGGGNVNMKDAALLSQFTDTFQQVKQQKLKQQQEEQLAKLQQFTLNRAQSDEAAKTAAEDRLRQLGQFNSGATGPLSNSAYSQQAQMAKNPYLQMAANQLQMTGSAPSGADATRLIDATNADAVRVATARNPGLKLDKYRQDENGKTYEIAVDSSTGRQIGKGTIQAPPEIPNPLVDKIYGDLAEERKTMAMPAVSTLRAYSEIDKILNSPDGKIVSGAFSNPELFFKRVANGLGADYADVQNTQKLRALFAQPVAQMIKNFGAGTGLSDADRQFAQQAVGGDISLDAKTIKELTRIGKTASENIIKNYNSRIDETFPSDASEKPYIMARRALLIPDISSIKAQAPGSPVPVSAAPVPAVIPAASQQPTNIDALVNKYLKK